MRIEHWEIALHDAIQAARERPFSYGTHDCATFAFNVRLALTGEDVAAEWRGRYSTELGAKRMLTRLGHEDVAGLATHHLGEPQPVGLSRRGDIVLIDGALGVCVGAKCAFAGHSGLVFHRLLDCTKAWRV